MTKSLVIALVVAAGGAAGLTAWWLATTRHTGPATAVVPVATAAVVRTNLATTTQMSGTIGYADSYTITAQLPGTITALPGPGAVVTRGHPAFEVDGSGVFLFYGTRPAWRSFEIGMTPGRMFWNSSRIWRPSVTRATSTWTTPSLGEPTRLSGDGNSLPANWRPGTSI